MDTAAKILDLGKTHYGLTGTIPSTYGDSLGMEGTVLVFKDEDPTDRSKYRSHHDKTFIIVRNTGAVNLLPKQTVVWESGYVNRRVNGKAYLTNGKVAGVVDEYLPAAGVRVGDLFLLCVKGPSLFYTPMEGDVNNVFAVGDHLWSQTAATSGATTAGRLKGTPGEFSATAATDGTMVQQALKRVGWAMSAGTTGETNSSKLMYVDLY